MPGVFADILNSLTSGQGNPQTPVQRLDQAGAGAIGATRQGLSDFELMLRKLLMENFGGPTGPGGPAADFVGPVQQQAPAPNLIQQLFGGR